MRSLRSFVQSPTVDWALTAAAVGFLAVYAWPILDPDLSADAKQACSVATVSIWILFGLDYLTRLGLAAHRWTYVREHGLDLVVLIVPLLRPLRALRVVTALGRLNRQASMSFRGQAVIFVIGAVGLLSFVSAVAVLDAERDAREANISTFSDALWWSATTITTVGYGDRFPTTGEGRLVGAGLMVSGIALLGVVTAALASWFVERIGSVERAEEQTRDEVAALTEEIRALRAQVQAAAQQR